MIGTDVSKAPWRRSPRRISDPAELPEYVRLERLGEVSMGATALASLAERVLQEALDLIEQEARNTPAALGYGRRGDEYCVEAIEIVQEARAAIRALSKQIAAPLYERARLAREWADAARKEARESMPEWQRQELRQRRYREISADPYRPIRGSSD